MRYNKNCYLTAIFLILISIVFLVIGLSQVNQTMDPAFEETGWYLEGSLFIKEHGGILNFVNLCLTGQYKVTEQHPFYLLLLSSFASRDFSFFSEAKLLTLFIGLVAIVSLFFITKDLFGQSTAFIASALMAFNVHFLKFSSHVAVEPLLILFVLLSWYFMVKGLDSNKNWIWAGISSGLAFMAKGTGIFMIPVFIITNLLIFRLRILRNKYFWLFFFFFLVPSSILILRNIIVYKVPMVEGINSHAFWLDSWDEISNPEYGQIIDWKGVEIQATNLPTMLSYIETHSISQIVKRAVAGIKGESSLLLNSMNMLIIPKRKVYLSFLLFILFFLGLIRDKDRKRTIYTIMIILIFFIPFAWLFQVLQVTRYITPVIPFIAIYSSLGCIELVKYVDTKLLASHKRFNLLPVVPHVLIAVLVLLIGYFIATGKVYPSIRSVKLSDDQYELFGWIKNNVKEDDAVILGPTNHYWGYLWYADFKGKLVIVPKESNLPMRESFSAFNDFLKKRNVSLIIMHKDNYLSLPLGNYFEYKGVDGLIQKKPIDGWELVYKYSKKPTEFLIYQIEWKNTNSS